MNDAFGHLGKFILNRLRKTELRAENIRAISSHCQGTYLGDYQVICKVLGRFAVYIDSRDRTLGMQLLTNGFWEMEITECIARCVKKDMTVIDVGANYGYFSLLMAGLTGNASGTVYAIEANPHIHALLTNSIRTNGLKKRVKAINCAIIDGDEQQMQFNFRQDKGMNGHLDVYKKQSDHEDAVMVKANKLDNIITAGEKIDFIKVDIEGAEHLFWLGSHRVRQDNPNIKILLEFNAKRYPQAEAFIDDIFAEGFRIKWIKRTVDLDCYLSKQDLLGLPTDTHVMLLLERGII